MKKKILILSLLVLLFGLAPHVFAQGFVPLAKIPGLTDIQPDTNGLATFFNNLYKYLIGLAAALAVIEIIWGGLEYSTKDSVSKKSDGKERIYQALLGLVLVLSPVLVFSFINPSILNLSVNIPKLDTTSSTINTTGNGLGGTGSQTPIIDTTTRCEVSGAVGILLIAKCPSSAAAQQWGNRNCTDGGLLTNDAITTATNGTGLYVATCQGTQIYTFINTAGTFNINSTINRLQPIAQTPRNPNNADSAISFASTCKNANLGWKTCIKGVNWFSDVVDCPPTTTQLPVSASRKCYEKGLVCGNNSFLYNTVCDSSPSWAPFQ